MNFMILLSPKTQALELLGCCYLLKLKLLSFVDILLSPKAHALGFHDFGKS